MSVFATLKLASFVVKAKTLIIQHWKIALVLALCGVIYYQNTMSFEVLKPFGLRTLPGLYEEMAEIQKDLDTEIELHAECKRGRLLLIDQVKDTNKQVNRWYQVSQGLQKQQEQLNAEIADLRKQGEADVQAILDGPVPETCEAAIQRLRDAAK